MYPMHIPDKLPRCERRTLLLYYIIGPNLVASGGIIRAGLIQGK